MAYDDHFRSTDALIAHLDPILLALKDPFIESKYTGFLSVSAVTVLELSLKAVFIEFASRKHSVFGRYCGGQFERINGRIKLDDIAGYIGTFGDRYHRRFKRDVERLEREQLRATGQSIRSAYGNLITWRHQFTHQGIMPAYATYLEVKNGYSVGKVIMKCLANSMRR